jgi:pyruvate carboxylase
VHKGEEIANLEAMKMENAILAPFDGQIIEVCVKLNETVQEGQLLFVLEKLSAEQQNACAPLELPQLK